jgi:predicted Fe-Mo cluster-binding NifX family protein
MGAVPLSFHFLNSWIEFSNFEKRRHGTILAEPKAEGLMKVAIPVFGHRVSPRFDFAPGLILFTLENGKVIGREELSLLPWGPWQRVERLKELQVQTLICGGIDGDSENMLLQERIQVIPWIAGEVQEALDAFLKGNLQRGATIYPRCGRRGQRWARRFYRRRVAKE